MQINIAPIQGFGKTGVKIDLQPFVVDAEKKRASCHWVILDEDGNDVVRRTSIFEGSAYEQWGTDDNYAVNLVLADAGVQRAA